MAIPEIADRGFNMVTNLNGYFEAVHHIFMVEIRGIFGRHHISSENELLFSVSQALD